MKAMILAAGMGTRLAPFTNTKPKVLLPVGSYTLLELTIRFLKKHGITKLVINVHHFANQVVDYLEKNKGFGLPYQISDERIELMNTGGALVYAKKYLYGDEPFILTGSDILTGLDLSAMIKYHRQNKPLVTLAVKDRPTSRLLLFDENYRLCGWKSNENGKLICNDLNKAQHSLGFSTIHVIEPKLLNLITEQGSFSIMDTYLRLMDSETILGYRHDESDWIEFGRTERLEETLASQRFKKLIRTV